MDFISSTHMGMAVRTYQEDPWERIRLMHAAMPNTPLQFIGTGFRFISWELSHPDFMQLVYNRLVANGISRFIVLDPMHDLDACLLAAKQIRKAGGEEIMAALTYTISEVHNDGFYANFARQISASPNIDRVYLKDPSGLLTPERTRSIVPAMVTCRWKYIPTVPSASHRWLIWRRPILVLKSCM
jgi:oxaloacetate decarboxylase alpha subunit